MITLALEFSSEQRSVAVVAGSPGTVPRALGIAGASGRGPATAPTLIDQALRKARVAKSQVERVAVGLGPGSYTGIRMSIAVAQAWQLARGVGLFGLSSAEVMARLAKAIGWRGRIHLVIDAQRDEFYLVVYEVSDAAVVELSPLRLASIAEVGRLAAAGAIVAGPEAARRWPGGRALFPDAEVLGELCAERVEGVSGERLEPIYLRPANFVKALGPRAPTAGR